MSTTTDLQNTLTFVRNKATYDQQIRGYKPTVPVIVRIDSLALFWHGLLTEVSFADLSTEPKFHAVFDQISREDMDEIVHRFKVDVRLSKEVSIMLGDVSIGLRGTWWPPYATIMDEGDRIISEQTGGHNGTTFGAN